MDIRTAISCLLEDENFQTVESKIKNLSAFHILNIENSEIPHAAFLAWLLDPAAQHGMGEFPLRSFMMLASKIFKGDCDKRKNVNPDKFIDSIIIDSIDFNKVSVFREFKINIDGKSGRLDILICFDPTGSFDDQSKFIPLVIIEYKVESGENNNQTKFYAEWSRNTNKYDDAYGALHLYIAPNNALSRSFSPAFPFLILDYETMTSWMISLDDLEKSRQASFLLNEFVKCIRRQRYVVGEEIGSIVEKIKKSKKDAIDLLNRSNLNAQGDSIRSVINRHKDAFQFLDISIYGRGSSKGVSQFVKYFKNCFIEVLSKVSNINLWRFSTGQGSLASIYIPFSKKLTDEYGEKADKLRCHFFMDRPSNQRARFVFEFMYGLDGQQPDEARLLRQELADSFRLFLSKKMKKEMLGRDNTATVFSYSLKVSGLIRMDDDTEELAHKNKESIEKFIEVGAKKLINNIDPWMDQGLFKIMNKWICEEA